MKRTLLSLFLLFAFAACTSSQQATLPTEKYGYVEEDPIRVAGLAHSGPASERAYLDRLRGPNGEAVTYERLGSCCGFETSNGIMGTGLLDMYQVEYDGIDAPVTLYLNMYAPPGGSLRPPAGFTMAR